MSITHPPVEDTTVVVACQADAVEERSASNGRGRFGSTGPVQLMANPGPVGDSKAVLPVMP